MTNLPRSILAATDLSEASDTVLRGAAALAALLDAELHVLHVLDLPLLPYAMAGAEAVLPETQVAAAEASLREQLHRTLPAHVRAASELVRTGSVGRAILQRAEEVAAGLLVLGAHRPRPFADRFLGSTADRIIRTSPIPCLLVRKPLRLPLRRIMVPTDLSEQARPALDAALAWARALGVAGEGADREDGATEIQVIHVIPRAYEMPDFAFDREVIEPELEREVNALVERAQGTVDGAAIHPRVRWGDVPADEIVQAAEREKVDLLVLTTHGHGALRRALLGSVATTISRGAPCPVLLLPPTPDAVES